MHQEGISSVRLIASVPWGGGLYTMQRKGAVAPADFIIWDICVMPRPNDHLSQSLLAHHRDRLESSSVGVKACRPPAVGFKMSN